MTNNDRLAEAIEALEKDGSRYLNLPGNERAVSKDVLFATYEAARLYRARPPSHTPEQVGELVRAARAYLSVSMQTLVGSIGDPSRRDELMAALRPFEQDTTKPGEVPAAGVPAAFQPHDWIYPDSPSPRTCRRCGIAEDRGMHGQSAGCVGASVAPPESTLAEKTVSVVEAAEEIIVLCDRLFRVRPEPIPTHMERWRALSTLVKALAAHHQRVQEAARAWAGGSVDMVILVRALAGDPP